MNIDIIDAGLNKNNKNKCSLLGLKIRDNNNTCISKTIRRKLKNNLKCKSIKNKSKKELCLIETNSIKNKYYLPKRPKQWTKKIDNKSTKNWLSNIDIREIMTQFEDVYTNFNFVGSSPIDFSTKINGVCVCNKLCNFQNYVDKHPSIKEYGIIFNTSKHNSAGEHWISMFIDINTKTIYFSDSSGEEPPKEIYEWINTTPMFVDYKFNYNRFEHQKKNTECGMYSILFISSFINKKNKKHIFNTWNSKRLKDEVVFNFRKKLFR